MSFELPTPRRLLSRLRADDLLQDGSILIVASLFTGVVNYAYQVLMGRFLGPEQYGVFGALFALSYMLLVFSRGVQLCSTKYVSTLSTGRMAGFLRGFGLRISAVMIVLFGALWLAAPAIARTLKIADPLLVVLVCVTLLFGPVNAITFGALRGLQHFRVFGGIQVGRALLKLGIGIGLVLLGFGTYGAVGGPVIGVAAAFFVSVIYLRRWFLADGSFSAYGEVYRFAAPSLLVAFCMTVPTNADVVVVKQLFAPVTAGLYTAVSVFGKVLIFLPLGITGALFPKAASRGESRPLLVRALFYTAVLAFGAALVLVAVPRLALGVLYGGTYAAAAPVLRWYVLAIGAFSLCTVLLNYSLAVDDLRFVKAFTALTVAGIGLFYLFGSSPLRIAQVMLAVNAVGFVGGYLLFFSRTAVARRGDTGHGDRTDRSDARTHTDGGDHS